MPIYKQPIAWDVGAPAPPSDPTAPPADPSTSEIFDSAWRLGMLGSLRQQFNTDYRAGQQQNFVAPEPGYNPLNDLPDELVPVADLFIDARSKIELDANIDRYQKEQADRQVVENGGWMGMLAMIATGAADPVTLASAAIPGGVFVRGATLPRMAGAGATMAAADVALSEAILQDVQVDRSEMETLYNIAGAAITGGLLSGGVGLLARRHDESLPKDLNDVATELLSQQPGEVDRPVGTPGAAGAAPRGQWIERTLEETEPTAGGGSRLGRFGTWLWTPLGRMENSLSTAARALAASLANSGRYKKLMYDGEAAEITVESLVEVDYARSAATYQQQRWRRLKEVDKDGLTVMDRLRPIWEARRGTVTGTDSLELFVDTQIADAVRQGGRSYDAQIARMAREFKETVLDPVKRQLDELGIDTYDFAPLGAKGYFPRVYDVHKIARNKGAFIVRLQRHFQNEGIDATEAQSIAHEVTQTIMGTPEGRITNFGTVASKFQERTLAVPDRVLAPFLVNDIAAVTDHYLGTYLPDIHITHRFGDADASDAFAALAVDYFSRMAAAAKTADPKTAAELQKRADDLRKEAMAFRGKKALERLEWSRRAREAAEEAMFEAVDIPEINRLYKAWNRDREDFVVMLERLKRMSRIPRNPDVPFSYGNVAGMAKDLAFMSMLGQVLLAAIPELAYIMMSNSARTVAKAARVHGLNPRSLKFKNQLKGFNRESVQSLRAAGVGIEDLLHSRRYLYGSEAASQPTGARRFTAGMADRFAQFTGIEMWTNNLKWIAGYATQDKFLRGIRGLAEGAKVKRQVEVDMRRAGFSDDTIDAIYELMQQPGGLIEDRGILKPDLNVWNRIASETGDQRYWDAILTWETGVSKEVNFMVVTPGIGDMPNVADKQWAELMFQFKRFFMASHGRIVKPMLQRMGTGDAQTFVGFGAALALSYVGIVIRDGLQVNKTGEFAQERTPEGLAREIVDRSGVTGLMMEGFNVADKLSGQRISETLNMQGENRYTNRTQLSAIAGPASSYFEAAALQLPGALADGDISPADVRLVRKLLPFNNLFWARPGIDVLEKSLQEAVE